MKGAGMGGGGERRGEWQLHFNTSLLARIWQHFKGVDESGFVVPEEGKGIAGGVQDVGQGVGLSMVVYNSENGEVGVFPMRVVGGVRYSMVVNNWDWQGVSLFQWGGGGGGGGRYSMVVNNWEWQGGILSKWNTTSAAKAWLLHCWNSGTSHSCTFQSLIQH